VILRFQTNKADDDDYCIRDFTGPKQLKISTFDGVFVIRLQLELQNFGQWESLRGTIVDIPRMCLLWVSFGGDVYTVRAL